MSASSIRNSNGIWINTSVFREAAIHFDKYGYYHPSKPGSYLHKAYWDEERDRHLNGLEVAGAKITGYHYAYLNYHSLSCLEKSQKM